jgi:hypothetical protein
MLLVRHDYHASAGFQESGTLPQDSRCGKSGKVFLPSTGV